MAIDGDLLRNVLAGHSSGEESTQSWEGKISGDGWYFWELSCFRLRNNLSWWDLAV